MEVVRGQRSRRVKREKQEEQMIAHVPTVMGVETEDAPFVFSPRISEDGSAVMLRRRRKLLRNIRSVFCCGAPETGTAMNGTDGNTTLSSPAVYPADEGVDFIIGEASEADKEKKTLVLDLDETLVHSSFNRVPNPDYIVPVEIDGRMVDVYVQKRPGLDAFLRQVCPLFEVVVFTASLRKYANPLLDLMDREGLFRWRLFREACSIHRGTYVKDLRRLGRSLSRTIIVDNSPLSYILQPGNALPITTYLGDHNDCALSQMTPILEELSKTEDVRDCLHDILGEGNASLSTNGDDVVIPVATLQDIVAGFADGSSDDHEQ